MARMVRYEDVQRGCYITRFQTRNLLGDWDTVLDAETGEPLEISDWLFWQTKTRDQAEMVQRHLRQQCERTLACIARMEIGHGV